MNVDIRGHHLQITATDNSSSRAGDEFKLVSRQAVTAVLSGLKTWLSEHDGYSDNKHSPTEEDKVGLGIDYLEEKQDYIMKNTRLGGFCVLTCLGILMGCSPTTAVTDMSIDGTIQKGPYIKGSNITISQLNDQGVVDVDVLRTRTTNDMGNFIVTLQGDGIFQIRTDAYFYNDIHGVVSREKLTLDAIAFVGDDPEGAPETINVNILTHVTASRIKVLMRQGVPCDHAIGQAEREWLIAFRYLASIEGAVNTFSTLNLYQNGIGESTQQAMSNRYLLFASAVFYQYALDNSEASLPAALNSIALDFSNDGKLDESIGFIKALEFSALQLDAEAIKHNLESPGVSKLGDVLTVADIAPHITE